LQGGRKPYPAVPLRARLSLALGFRASVIALSLLGTMTPAFAKSDLLTKSQISENATNQPLLLQADQLITDSTNDRITAKGNVEVYYKNYALQANELVYDRKAKTLDAIGNVRIKEPDNAIITADRISLTEDFRDGFIRSFQAVTKDDARISAANAYRKDGNVTVFERGTFTPCKPCATDPNAAPIWQIRANKITHNKDEQNIYFEDGTFDIFGVPVAWVPYFYYPDPTVKRRTGFLPPSFKHSSDLGYYASLPYYFAISPSKDLTITPEVTSKAGTMLEVEWRQRFEHGAYKVELAGSFDDDPADPTVNEFRGSVVTKGEFELNSFWRWGWDATLESDDTFRRYYRLDDIYATDRMSKIYLVGQAGRNYFEADLYHFGGLTSEDTSASKSVVHPSIDYNYIFAEPVLGGELAYDSNVLSLERNSGGDVNRFVNQVKWRRTMTDSLGQVYTPFAQVRGDLYQATGFVEEDGTPKDGFSGARGTVVGGFEYRYPFVKHTETASHVFEPIAQVIVRPDIQDQGNIPNEDAQSLVFDDTLLFDTDKFSGYDRIETGTRANVGVRYSIDTNSGLNARFVAGQSYQVAGENSYAPGTGLERSHSDYVTGVYLDLMRNVQFVAQTRFDEHDLSLKREDLQISGSYGPVMAGVNYVNAKAQPELGFEDDREEVAALAGLKVSDHWTVFGDIRYDLDSNDIIRNSIGVKYSDECFMLSVTYAETNITDGALKPDQSWLIKYDLMQLGGGSDSRTDTIGAFSPEAPVIR